MDPESFSPELKLIASGGSAISGGDIPASESYKRGRALFENGKFLDALREFERTLKTDAECLPALRYKGFALFKLKRYGEARAALEKVLLLASEDPYAYHNLGVAIASLAQEDAPTKGEGWHRDRLDEARVLLKKALRKKQDDARLWDSYGLLLMMSREFVDAVAVFDRLLKKDPGNAAAWNNKGLSLLYSMEDTYYRYSGSSFFHIIKLHTLDTDKKLAQAGRDNVKKAIACFDKALATGTKDPGPLFNKARALSALAVGVTKLDEHLFGDALEAIDAALAVDPKDPETLAYKGIMIYVAESASALRPLSLERISDATASLESAAEGTDNVFLLFELGRFLSETGWLTGRFESNYKPSMRAYRSAYAVFDKILGLKPDDRALLRATKKEQEKAMDGMKRWGDRDD